MGNMPQGGAIAGNAADDALLVIRGSFEIDSRQKTTHNLLRK
jgi:hypothetical protein